MMNKKIGIILSLVFFSVATSWCQIGGYKISYEFVMPSLTNQSVITNGLLEINDSVSLFSYYKTGLIDSTMKLSSSYFNPNKGAVLYASSYDEKGAQVYRNFKT